MQHPACRHSVDISNLAHFRWEKYTSQLSPSLHSNLFSIKLKLGYFQSVIWTNVSEVSRTVSDFVHTLPGNKVKILAVCIILPSSRLLRYVLEIQAVVFVYFLQKLRQLLEYKPILGTQRDFECESPFSHALRLIGAYRKRAVVSPEAAGEQSLNQQRPWESGLAQQTRDSETSPPLYQTSSATEEAGPDTTSQSLESRHLS